MYVKDEDLFVTLKLLEDTPPVLSLGRLRQDHGNSFEWIVGHKPHLIKNGRTIPCNTENYVPIVVPGLSSGGFQEMLPPQAKQKKLVLMSRAIQNFNQKWDR